jgi:hypothetical protein
MPKARWIEVLYKRLVLKNLLESRVLRTRSVGAVGSVGASAVALRHRVWVDAQLLHTCDERSPFESEASGSTIWAANATSRFFEDLDDLIAINFGEDAPYKPAFAGSGSCPSLARWLL